MLNETINKLLLKRLFFICTTYLSYLFSFFVRWNVAFNSSNTCTYHNVYVWYNHTTMCPYLNTHKYSMLICTTAVDNRKLLLLRPSFSILGGNAVYCQPSSIYTKWMYKPHTLLIVLFRLFVQLPTYLDSILIPAEHFDNAPLTNWVLRSLRLSM